MQIDRPWVAHYDKQVPATLNYPKVPLFHFLEESARKYPDRACTIFQGQAIPFKDMDRITDSLAAALADLGTKKGDRVGILMPNTPQFVMAYYAILKAGAAVVAINPLYTPAEITYQAKDAGVGLVFVLASLYKTLQSAQPGTPIRGLIVANLTDALPPLKAEASTPESGPNQGFSLDGDLGGSDVWMQDLIAGFPPEARPKLDIGSEDTALFQYSGGTTGISKAAVASHRGVVANTVQFRTWLVTLEEGREIMLMAIPLFHAYGMIAGMSLGVALGASLALVPSARDMPELLETINRHHPTVFPGVPSLYTAINNHPDVKAGKVDLRSITVCISGSTALLRDTKDRFEALSGSKICEGYGLSEAPVVTHCNPLLGINKLGSIGMPMPDVECRIVDPDNAELDMPAGDPGELIIRGPQVMKGYHNMPTETASSLRALTDGETWLFTGDIVRMDEDGYFYVIDRKKELIKPGGFQVWPREVEEVIAANPKVQEVGVAGIPDPDRGETVKAWIVLKPEQALTPEEIKAWCKPRLAPYKVPTHIEFRSELPKTNVGKILRRELVRQHTEAKAVHG